MLPPGGVRYTEQDVRSTSGLRFANHQNIAGTDSHGSRSDAPQLVID